jgi:hypothetical protein
VADVVLVAVRTEAALRQMLVRVPERNISNESGEVGTRRVTPVLMAERTP